MQAASRASSPHLKLRGTYPLLLVGHRGLARVLARLHEVGLQLRDALLRLSQQLPGRLRIPQLQRTHETSRISEGLRKLFTLCSIGRAHLSVLHVHPVLGVRQLEVQIMAFPLPRRQLLAQLCRLLLRCLEYGTLRDLRMARHPALQLLNLPAREGTALSSAKG